MEYPPSKEEEEKLMNEMYPWLKEAKQRDVERKAHEERMREFNKRMGIQTEKNIKTERPLTEQEIDQNLDSAMEWFRQNGY